MNQFLILMFVLHMDGSTIIYKAEERFASHADCLEVVEERRDEFGQSYAEMLGPITVTSVCIDEETLDNIENQKRANEVDGIAI